MFSKNFRTYLVVWFGQLVSLLGTAMTRFALLIWLFQQDGKATNIALLSFFAFIPYILVSPIAGVWVDRLNRRIVMIFSDMGAGLMTLTLFVLLATDNLAIWHLFLAEFMSGLFESFQLPAYEAATTQLVPKSQFARASGLRSLARYGSEIGAPIIAGILLAWVDIRGVMLVDIATFLIAMVTLLLVRFPKMPASTEPTTAKRNSWQEMKVGWQYIWQRKGLLGLTMVFVGVNFFAAITYFGIMPAMVLSRTGGDELALAWVQGALGAGGVLGGIAVSVWGLPKHKIHAIFLGAVFSFLTGDLAFGMGQTLPVWVIGGFLSATTIPFILAGDRAIWQEKVPINLQGRVFAVQGSLRTLAMPLGYLIAGPLADRLFEPAMMAGGKWVDTWSWLVGEGAGAGMGLMFMVTAFAGAGMALVGYLMPALRNVETDLPDMVE